MSQEEQVEQVQQEQPQKQTPEQPQEQQQVETKSTLDILPAKNEEYKTKEYWEKRYEKEPMTTTFEWFKGWPELKDTLVEHLNKEDVILMLGCGNSKLSEDMYDEGYQKIFNIDFSQIVISNMKMRNTKRDYMIWETMDIKDMAFDNNMFDVAIDKGTMDALLCEKGDVWDPEPELLAEIKKYVDEVYRVLKPNGKFIYITFGQPHFRKRHFDLDTKNWTLETKTIGDNFHYFVYILTKQDGAN